MIVCNTSQSSTSYVVVRPRAANEVKMDTRLSLSLRLYAHIALDSVRYRLVILVQLKSKDDRQGKERTEALQSVRTRSTLGLYNISS